MLVMREVAAVCARYTQRRLTPHGARGYVGLQEEPWASASWAARSATAPTEAVNKPPLTGGYERGD